MTFKVLIIIINLTLFGLFGWATYQQITNQQKTNLVMAEVHRNIQKAGELTKVTNQQLTPLRQTAATIEKMNAKLGKTHQMLATMNQSLNKVTQSEQKIVTGLDLLNSHTFTVINQLQSVSTANQGLTPVAGLIGEQTKSENSYLSSLSRLTNISIVELTTLNRKLVWLSYLP